MCRSSSSAPSASASVPVTNGRLVSSTKTSSGGLTVEYWNVAGGWRDEAQVVIWRLSRPKQANALSESLIEDLAHETDKVHKGNAELVRAIFIEGEGRAFCGGHDLRQMMLPDNRRYSYYRELFERCAGLMLQIRALPQPVVCVVDGVATAAGCQLVAASDLCVASSRASFGTSGINYNLFCSVPAVPLARSIPRKVALDMLMTGELISGERAHALGLVSRLVPVDSDEPVPSPKLAAARDALIHSLLSKSGAALAQGKQVFYDQMHLRLQQGYMFAAEKMARNMVHDDTQTACNLKFGPAAAAKEGK